MLYRVYILSFLLFAQLAWAGQSNSGLDSTFQKIKKVTFYFSLDIRRSLVRDIPVRISGLKIGVRIKQNHSIGVGYYNLGVPFFGQYYISNPVDYDADQTLFSRRQGKNVNVETRFKLSMAYFSLFYEHRFLARRKWNMDITGQIGNGILNIDVFNKQNGRKIVGESHKPNVKLVEASISVQYKMTSWLYAGAGVGYRQMINTDEYVSKTFNYPIYTLKLILVPNKLVSVFNGQRKWHE